MAKKFDAKAKAKRQKIILGVLGVVFVGVLAWQVPSVLSMMNEKPPPPAASPPPATAVPVPGAPAAGTPVVAGTPAPSGTLIDSDPRAQAAGGQLVMFDRFESKDPFEQQLATGQQAEGGGGQPAPPKEGPTTAKTGGSSSPPRPAPASAPSSAEISVNGSVENVSVGAAFPQADPMFSLVSVTKTTAKIGISGGSLDSGAGTITLRKGKKLTLENTVDGSRYTLVLVDTD